MASGLHTSHDDMVAQVANLSAQLAAMHQHRVLVPQAIKIPIPKSFAGERDSESVRVFIDAVDNWFDLTGVADPG